MRRQRGFWNAVAILFWLVVSVLTMADLTLRFWRWHFAPAAYNLDARGVARRRRILVVELLIVLALGIGALAFSQLGPIRPIHEWRN